MKLKYSFVTEEEEEKELDGIKIASNFKDMKSPSPQNPIPNNPIPDNPILPTRMANYQLNNQTDCIIVSTKFISRKMTMIRCTQKCGIKNGELLGKT